MELATYLDVIWRRRWTVLLVFIMTVAVVTIGTFQLAPTYAATTTLRFATTTTGLTDWVNYNIAYADRLMNTYINIATSDQVHSELTQRLGLQELLGIDADIVPNTELLRITVTHHDPVVAAEAANQISALLIESDQQMIAEISDTGETILLEQLNQIVFDLEQAEREYDNLVMQNEAGGEANSERIAVAGHFVEVQKQTRDSLIAQYEHLHTRQVIQANTFSVSHKATVPGKPASPNPPLNIALASIIGLVAGIGLAFLLENFDSTIYAPAQIPYLSNSTLLAEIPNVRRHTTRVIMGGNTLEGEAFRRLRTNLLSSELHCPPDTFVVVSAEPREGKTTVAANLALTFAQAGRRVLLIDGNLRAPTLHRIFGLSNDMGFSMLLKQQARPIDVIMESKIPELSLLPSGPPPRTPTELLSSTVMKNLMEQFEHQFDVVLFDSPALLSVADAAILATIVQHVVLVVGSGQARRETTLAAWEHLNIIQAQVAGVVVNRTPIAVNPATYYKRKKNRFWSKGF